MGSVFSVSISCDALITQGCTYVANQAGYLRGLPDKLDDLRSSMNELEAIRNDVQRRVDVAEHGGSVKRLDVVQQWLTSVDDSMSQARALIETVSVQHGNNGCFCVGRYKFGKKIVNKKGQLAELVSKGVSFDVVGQRLATKPATLRPSEPLVGVETELEEIWRCFEDDRVGVIGLYGMGGVGKTTLLTEIHNKLAGSMNNFDYVIWVDVKRNQTLEEVQVSIGKKLGFDEGTLASKSEHDKYEDISRVLNGKKFVLLLDNLWDRLDLLKAGVPYPDENNGCKILFTTRSEILCGQMEAHKKIKLGCLDPDKAWELFRKKVHDDAVINNPEIIELAKSVFKECGSLPLALVTVGRAMASKKTPEEWSHAIATLRRSASKFSGMENEVHLLLKFSYDSLPNDVIKACLLRLALHPESSVVTKRRLIGEWFAEGLLREHDAGDDYEHHGYDIIGTLLSMCLLEVMAEDERNVRLHDVVRDMVLWVASECGTKKDTYLVEAGLRLQKVPRVGKWNNARVVSLMYNKIEEITEEPVCPNLEALYLGHNSLMKIAPGFFSSMGALRVLDLSHNESLTELPMEVCQLVALENINLEFTGIRRLPAELRNLVKLKVLDITGTSQLTVIPRHLLSSLSALQALRMGVCGSTDQMQEDNVISGGNELLIEEVGLLRNLIVVDLTLRSDRALKLFLSFNDLMICTKGLCIQLLKDSTSLDLTFLEVAKSLQWLYISDCENLTSLSITTQTKTQNADTCGTIIDPALTIKQLPCFKKLLVIEVRSCPNLKDLTVITFAPNLEFVEIMFCDRLEKVIATTDLACNGGETPTPFAKLRMLWLVNLPQLTSICDQALPFPVLNQVLVRGCPRLKRLPVDSRRAEGLKIKIWTEENWWNGLQWEDEAAANAFATEFDIDTFFKD